MAGKQLKMETYPGQEWAGRERTRQAAGFAKCTGQGYPGGAVTQEPTLAGIRTCWLRVLLSKITL